MPASKKTFPFLRKQEWGRARYNGATMGDAQFNDIDFSDPLLPDAKGGRIGVVALATDLTIESDLRRMMPPGAEIFTNRVQNANPLTLENLRAMRGDIRRAAAGLLPGAGVGAVIYGCTSGAAAMGDDAVVREIQMSQNAPATTPLLALDAACAALSADSLSILTPYLPEINREMVKRQRAAGRTVVNINGLGFDDDCEASRISPSSIRKHAARAFCRPAKALFISCTALRASEVIGEIENDIGAPVIASNQALAWHALRLLGRDDAVEGFGELFRRPLPSSGRGAA